MNKYILGIDGMKCGMCEAHVEETIRKNIDVIKAKASHLKNEVVVITEYSLTEEDFKKYFEPTGYRVIAFRKTVAEKTFFGWK